MKIRSAHVNASNKNKSLNKESHVSPTKKGMGDYYGTGVRNPIGKVRDVTGINPVSPKKIKTPPRSLA